jgi:hypothetical protein
MRAWARLLRPALPVLAGALIYLGERVLPGSLARWPLSAAGAAALLAALLWSLALWWRARRQSTAQAGAWRLVLLPLLAFVLAAAAYGVTLPLEKLPAWSARSQALAFGAALAAAIGATWFVFIELAIWSQGAAAMDPARVRRAGVAGLNLGLLIALVIALNFALNKMPWQWDVAYFKTTDPSQATQDAVTALESPIEVALFFTDGDAVGQLAGDYFRKLARSASGKVTVKAFDADLKPLEAKDFKARGNGVVIFRRGEQIKPIQLGQSLERARAQLRKFDGDVLAAVIELSRERRTAYFTVGHGERNERLREDAEPETGVSSLEAALRGKAYVIKPLGLAQGLGSAIPDDAALVVIAGPEAPFSRPEAQAIQRYLVRGGRLLAFLEPRPAAGARQAADPLADVLAGYGIKFENVVQANDRIFARRTYTDADHALLVTTAFGPHPAANSLRRAPDQFPLVFLTAGALRRGPEPPNMQLRDVVKAMPGTWGDRNRNFRFDGPPETREDLPLVMGVGPAAPPAPPPPKTKDAEKPKPAAALPSLIVFADVDAASDLLMQNRANALLVADSVAWLAGDEAPAGLPSSEEDQRIQHAKGDDWLWFYLPVVGVPLMILVLGFVVTTRRRALGGRGP